jgi:N-acetylmuramoyl-L-alanine amidase
VLNWRSPGYHFIIERDGKVVDNWPIEKTTNGVKGHNHDSIHISYIGGIDAKGKPTDNRTKEQKQAMAELVAKLTDKFPNAKVLGHRDFPNVNKACPCFGAGAWWATVKKC